MESNDSPEIPDRGETSDIPVYNENLNEVTQIKDDDLNRLSFFYKMLHLQNEFPLGKRLQFTFTGADTTCVFQVSPQT